MKDKRVIGFFVGLLVAAALGGIYVLVKGPIGPMSGDDDRVVVAGGSLKILSFYGFETDSAGNRWRANHIHQNRIVNRLEIEYNDQGPLREQFDVKGPVMVDIEYRSEERRVGKECRSRWSP